MTVNLSTIGSTSTTSGTLTSTGIGSGLDINSIVTALVNAEVSTQQTSLQNTQTNDQTTISALGAVKSALSTLQSAADALTTGKALASMSATSSNNSILTASTTSSAVSGSYSVQVTQLAAANTIASGVYSSADSTVDSGSYAITAGGKTFSVDLSDGSTLANLRDAINGADDNSGVSASIVYAQDGARLLLTAQQSGTSNAVSVNSSAMSFSTVTPAADAELTVAGFNVVSASNVVTGAIDGVTLNLAQAQVGTQVNVSVSANTSSAASAVQTFVSAYNTAISLLTQATAYTPASGTATTGTAGPLQGDSSTMGLLRHLQSIIGAGTGTGSAISNLSDLGITTDSTGALTVDGTKLTSALQQNAAGVQNFFSGTNGVGTQLDNLLNGFIGTTGSTGLLDTKTSMLQDQVTSITNQLTALTARSAQLTQQYTTQFNAMDSIVAGYKNTSSLLTQLYAPRTTDSSGSSSSS